MSKDVVSLERDDAASSSKDVEPRIQQCADRNKHFKSSRDSKCQVRSDDSQTVSFQSITEFNSVHARPLSEFLIVEVFAGTARLSITAREAGFRSLPVDKTSERCRGAHIAIFDLTVDSEVERLLEIIESERYNIAWIHLAPACGTASRAREKKLTSLEKAGVKVPEPLRSEDFPMGFPWLKGLDAIRVDAANKVYSNTCKLVRRAHAWNICCTIENPENSLFWWFPDVVALINDIGGYAVVFHNCCHGGLRRKLTKFWATRDWFNSLCATCQNDHFHLDWKPVFDPHKDNSVRYPTSDEAAYPYLLCKRLVDAVRHALLQLGAKDISSLHEQLESQETTSHSFLLGALPRGKKFKQLVSEYAHYIHCIVLPNDDSALTELVSSFPKGAKALHRRFAKWGETRVDVSRKILVHYKLQKCEDDSLQVEVVDVGIPREPLDFCRRAIEVGHPRSVAVHISDVVKEALKFNFEKQPHHVAKLRTEFFIKWTKRARELATQEAELLKSAPEHLREILKGKRLVLLKEILAELNYPDTSLVDDIVSGFKLTGWLRKSNVFPHRVRHPEYDVQTLKMLAKGLNQSIKAQVAAMEINDVTRSAWETTKEELQKGWLWVDDDTSMDGKVVAKRFGLVQKNKTRVIDDFSICGLNAACGLREKFKIHAIDELAAYLSHVFTTSSKSGTGLDVVGKTFDLKSAYRQFGLSEDDAQLARVMVLDTDSNQPKLFGMRTLPFGAVGSVGGFLRVSYALWFVGIMSLKIAWTAFYDDFTVITSRALQNSTELAAAGLFDLLGIVFAKEGDKAVKFDKQFKTLGLQVDLRQSEQHEAFIGHTESRVAELTVLLQDILEAGRINAKHAESLRGRMLWFETYAFGRVGNSAVKKLGDLAYLGVKDVSLKPNDIAAIKFLKNRVLKAPPICINKRSLESWIIFVDGACEGDDHGVGTIGAVLIDPCGTFLHHFSEVVPASFMERCSYSKNHIYELEILPQLVSLLCWGHLVAQSQCVFYGDNDAARSSLIAGRAATLVASELVEVFVEKEMGLQIKPWFARVPTSSNIADDPSRLSEDVVKSLGSTKTVVAWDEVLASLERFVHIQSGVRDG